MGYDVHITRRENWFEEAGPEIELSEWLKLVESDSEMRLDGYAEAPLKDGDVLRVEESGLSTWTAYSRHGRDQGKAWFSFSSGNIIVKNPDPEILRKMWQLSKPLSARVQGDDGELYDQDGEVVPGAAP